MRIITGTARGARLETLEGEATRPTAERVKEALFSMIQFDLLDTNILDLFAGSGQLALEALSRGAEHAVLVDKSADACEIIKANAKKTRLFEKCRILTMDYGDYLRAAEGKYKFDFVFADPPYALDLYESILMKLAKADVLADGATVICESEDDKLLSNEKVLEKYDIVRHAVYGRVHLTLLNLKK